MTILALACFLVVGAALASILGRDSVPTVARDPAGGGQGTAREPERKKDKLPLAMAALPPAADNPQQLPEQLRQAFASDSPFSPQPPKIAAPSSIPLPADKPKAAAKPAVQKSYALLSDIQIAGIKERLKLSPAQEQHWPGVESALRAIAQRSTPPARPIPRHRRADRSRLGRSAAVEIGSDAAAVPAARRPEARSPLAGAHHRAGIGRVADLADWARLPKAFGETGPLRGSPRVRLRRQLRRAKRPKTLPAVKSIKMPLRASFFISTRSRAG